MKNNIFFHKTSVSKEDREQLNGHRGQILWFTGLSASGKSTIASQLELELHKKGYRTYILDGDNIRSGINKNLGFTVSDRKENIRRIAEIGKLFVDAGVMVLVSAISPIQEDREMAKSLFKEGEFSEIYIKCSIEECMKRDPKGLYQKAIKGEIEHFTGISSNYEEPLAPSLVIDTTELTVRQAVKKLFQHVLQKSSIVV